MLLAQESKTGRPWALRDLPPFPTLALLVMQELSHQEPDFRKVTSLINSEPVFAAELLRVSNSALFGFSSEIRSVPQAIVNLGFEFVRSLAMTVALRTYLSSPLRVPSLRRCWRHSLACALISEEVSAALGGGADAAYTAGLLHDIGRLALLAAWPKPYANALEVSIENGIDLIECERDLFDVDHCEAGLYLAAEWKLPADMAEAIGGHHTRRRTPQASDLCSIVALGCWLSDSLGFGSLPTSNRFDLGEYTPALPEALLARLDVERLMATTSARISSLE
jgi:putative nucleotidyltransferase with HDIG domain